MPVEPVGETRHMVGLKSDIFVHVEGRDPRPIDILFLAEEGKRILLAGSGGEHDRNAILRSEKLAQRGSKVETGHPGHIATRRSAPDDETIDLP